MQISPSSRNAYTTLPETLPSSDRKDQLLVQPFVRTPHSSKGGYHYYEYESVTPSKPLGANTNVDPVTQKISDAFKTVNQEASIFLKKKFADMADKARTPAEKATWNLDPDNTYLVTFDYNTTGDKPYPAKIIKRISLTEALITNAQATPEGKGYAVPFYAGGPDVRVKPDLKVQSPGIFDLSSRFSPNTEKADITHTYQGIYTEPGTSAATAYNEKTQSAVTPAQFKELIWNADFKKPYDEFLNGFWSEHEKTYPTLAKASLVKSAIAQYQEGSLSAAGRTLIMRAAGLPDQQASWPDITYEDLQKNPKKDPDIEVGLLKLGSHQSTDLMYITDTKGTPALTLLYIPGNSSPLHSFSSQAEMKTWLAGQMADPVKRNAMALHFALTDKPNSLTRAGIDETLAGLGTWPEKRETPGGLLNYDHRAFSGFWDPQTFISTEPDNLPFDEIAKRQKNRSYADADLKITSDGDVTKTNILSDLEKTAKAALFLTPLALVVPEVALALDAFYLADAAATTGIGIDDTVHGKPNGTERIVFGVFNAALVAAPHIVKAIAGGKSAAREIVANKLEPAPIEETLNSNAASDAARPHNQVPDYSAHALPDNFLEGRTPRGDGTYQVGDEFYIKFTDGSDESRVFQVERSYKGGGSPVRVVDPVTKQQVMMLVPTTDGEWRLANIVGGRGKKTLTAINPNTGNQRPAPLTGLTVNPSGTQPLLNHSDWQALLDSGTHNGQPVYIHYTSKSGAEAIAREQAINDAARGETRAGSKAGVYVNPPGQQFNNENVENLLFLGNERYTGRGDYMVIFSTDQAPQDLGAVTAGSPFVELKIPKEIKLTPANFLYLGPTRFPDYFG